MRERLDRLIPGGEDNEIDIGKRILTLKCFTC